MHKQKPIVFFSSDRNPFYSDFAPYVKKAWESFGFEVYYNVVDENNFFVTPDLIPFGNQSQICRVLLPALFPDRVCITADIDMLPLSREYFMNSLNILNNENENLFLSLSSDAYKSNHILPYKRHPICYLAGFGKTFSKITKVENEKQIGSIMLNWWAKGYKWDTDEICFSTNLYEELSKKTLSLKELNRGWNNGIANLRIDRDIWNYDLNKLNNHEYIDSHMLRPFSKFEEHLKPLFNSISIL